MFVYDGPQKAKERIDYTGLKIGAILAPVVLLFSYFGKADTGLAVFIVLGVMTVAWWRCGRSCSMCSSSDLLPKCAQG